MIRRPLHTLGVLLLLAMGCGPAFAHGLLLKLEAVEGHVRGTAYFTNGDVAADEWVEWTDLDDPGSGPTGARVDAAGRFEFNGVQGHRYRVRAYAEEGHDVELELRLEKDSRPELVDEDGTTFNPWWPPPAWLVIGGLLLVSTPLARLAPKRGAVSR